MSIAEKFEVIADEVYEKGKKDEYDKFWDANQDYGNRTFYASAFAGNQGWTKDNFYPKYDIKPEGNANQLFYAWEDNDKHKIDLAQRLQDCGVVLDTSQATNLQSAFNYSHFTRIPAIDIRATTIANSGLFANNWGTLITIDEIIMNEDNLIANTWFNNCSGLQNLIINGKIGQSGFDVKSCKKLTKESLLSILKALSLNITETTTITFSTEHQSIIETDTDCKPYWEAAKNAGWSFVYA